MLKRTVSGITLTLLLIGMLTLAFNSRPVASSPTIIIDGKMSDWFGISPVIIDPLGARASMKPIEYL